MQVEAPNPLATAAVIFNAAQDLRAQCLHMAIAVAGPGGGGGTEWILSAAKQFQAYIEEGK